MLDAIGGGCKAVIRSDIAKFFTRIPKSVVTEIVTKAVEDTDFVELFTRAIAVELENMTQLREHANAFPRSWAFCLTVGQNSSFDFSLPIGGEVQNNDLARELGFENPAYTSSLLGKITGKLRRVGIQSEGRNGLNWYSKRRVKGQTLLRVRADVLKVFEQAVAAIPR